MKILTENQIIRMQSSLIAHTGGSAGLREEGLLESALNAPFQTFGGAELYPTLLLKGARLGFSFIKNHPFVDGNKRIGAHAMLTFLLLNGIEIECSPSELTEIILGVASGESDFDALAEWLRVHA